MKALRVHLLISLVLVTGCAQDQEPAELATEYKNHVSFMLDGKEWVAGSDGSLSAIDEIITAEIGDEPGKRTFMLTAWNVEKSASSSLSFYIDSLLVGQAIDINGEKGRASLTTKSASDQKPTFQTSDALNSGSITIISLDSTTHRVTGKFDCKLGDRRISNGTFDTRYTSPKPM